MKAKPEYNSSQTGVELKQAKLDPNCSQIREKSKQSSSTEFDTVKFDHSLSENGESQI